MQSVLQATRNAMVCTPCASCGSTNFELDPVNFDQMCSDCGLIVEQSLMVNIDVQKTASGELEKLGTITNIRDNRVQWDKNEIHDAPILEMTNNTEKREYAFKKRLQYVVSGLHEDSEHFIDAINGALRIWRLCYEQRLTRGYDRDQLAAILFYMACRQLKPPLPYLLIDLAAIIQVNVFKLAKKFGKLCKDIPIAIETLSDPSIYISRFVNMLEFGDKTNVVTDTASKVVLQMKKDWITTGRRPAGVCGAAIFIAARIHGFIRTETEIVNVVGLSEGTLRKRIKEFLDTKSCQSLKVKDFVDSSLDAIKQSAHWHNEHEAPPVTKQQQRKLEKMQTLKQIEQRRQQQIAEYDEGLKQQEPQSQHRDDDEGDDDEHKTDDEDVNNGNYPMKTTITTQDDDEGDDDEHKTDDEDVNNGNYPMKVMKHKHDDDEDDEGDEDIDVLLGIKKETMQQPHRTVFVRATETDDSLQLESLQSQTQSNGKLEMDATDDDDASTNMNTNTNTTTCAAAATATTTTSGITDTTSSVCTITTNTNTTTTTSTGGGGGGGASHLITNATNTTTTCGITDTTSSVCTIATNTNTNTTKTTSTGGGGGGGASHLITNANAVQMDDYERAQMAADTMPNSGDEFDGDDNNDYGDEEEDDDLDEEQMLKYHEENDLSYLDDDATVQNMLLSEREIVAKTKLFQAINPDWHIVKQRMDEREMVKQEKLEIRDKKRKLCEALKNDPCSQYSSLVDRVQKRFKGGFIKNEVNIEAYYKLTGQTFEGDGGGADTRSTTSNQGKAKSPSINIKKCDPMMMMMSGGAITYINADLFSCPPQSAICCCVAHDFDMDKGILKQFKTRFNGVQELKTQHKNIGECGVLRREQQFVYYLITKRKYSERTDFDVLKASLRAMKEHAVQHKVSQICMPYIACGADSDEVQWQKVESIIENVFHDSNVG
eukprot:CAMPEP_0202729374 /NCGR_PEP_ID=MMETSP1385-20130828/186101_1 /ASSEMBLY_ACC=CAM_ASM_000861 /TAXON_ID=933848 /ORGANISM="Elphidium margaritaceum" /LENGTH=940 /DNA_ID=CAMNT_0049395635 /DNA_START=25 /DNA_END=2845 /DNA_ORIENTATION=+